MNKLVSRNPVQRFKQGRKIVKAQGGVYVPVVIGSSTFQYNPYNKTYKGFQMPGQNLQYQDIVNAFNQQYESLGEGNEALYRKKNSHTTWMNSRGKYIDKTPKRAPSIILESLDPNRFKGEQIQPNSQKPEIQDTPQMPPQDLKQKNTPPSRNPNRFISIYDKNGFWAKNAEEAGATDRDSVRALQIKMGLLGDAADGIWGANTQKAWENYKANGNKIAPMASNEVTPQFAEIPQNLNLDSTPKEFNPINKGQLRDLYKTITGKSAYNLTGFQRKALRQYINGEQYNKNDLNGIDLELFKDFRNPNVFKKGGNLPSRNPVERFKQEVKHRFNTVQNLAK